MTTILIATANAGKVREFREMVGDDRFVWTDLSQFPNVEPVEETGETFEENARLKASYYAKRFSTFALADDSGLVVDALNGAPGVFSARFAAMNNAGNGDAANNALLLRELANVSDEKRTARFVCVLALSNRVGEIAVTVRDEVEGRIAHHPRGENGFGYDPLFVIDDLSKTAAELPASQKHLISHRGKAIRKLRAILDKMELSEKSI